MPAAQSTAGYCMKCKKAVPMVNVQPRVAANGRNMLMGNCSNKTCNCKMSKMVAGTASAKAKPQPQAKRRS
jgi:hypothetical protein